MEQFESWKIIAIGIGIIVLVVGLIALLVLFMCARGKTKVTVLSQLDTDRHVSKLPDITPVEEPDHYTEVKKDTEV